MSNAPAGWYKDPTDDRGPRYWTGVGWLAPGQTPASAATGLPPQAGVFMPATSARAATEFRPAAVENEANASATTEPPAEPASLGDQAGALGGDVTWDVVGIPRKPDSLGPTPSSRPEWSPKPAWPVAAEQGYGSIAATPATHAPAGYPNMSYPQLAYASAPPLPYDSVRSKSRKTSGWAKVASVIGLVVIGFGARWAFALFFGADFSDDGRIEVKSPDYWTTYSIENPDITYAMDASWADYKGSAGSDISGKGVRVVTVRSLATDFSGKRAFLIMGTTTFSTPGAKASRQDFESALEKALGSASDLGGGTATVEKLKVLKTDAGDRWGIQSATFPIGATTITDYMAVSIIDDYAVVIQLIVPAGVELTEADILAVVNSIRAA